jgi:hypothetical protein
VETLAPCARPRTRLAWTFGSNGGMTEQTYGVCTSTRSAITAKWSRHDAVGLREAGDLGSVRT